MRQSNLFTKTLKHVPKDEVAQSAVLLLRGGFVYKEMAGVYSFLPLGLRVLSKIENIIREEMDSIGGQEVVLSALQNKETWLPTNQWDDKNVDVWFKTALKNETELGLAFTHEAPLTKLMKEYISSYRDLPKYVYQFQTKFRNEIRARSGVIRMREFVMKDLYSFSKDLKEHESFYEKAKEAYYRVFERLGLGDNTFLTFANGGVFAPFSHEFQTVCEIGEDTIYLNEKAKLAINKEVFNDEVVENLGFKKKDFVEKKSVEVGNIFTLGTRFSDALGLVYADEKGVKQKVIMGSYGIGPARAMATVVELFADEKGIVWPETIAPFKVHLLALGDSERVREAAEKLYKDFKKAKIEILFDDRANAGNGEKLGDADLIGCPWRVVVSEKSLDNNTAEVKRRREAKAEQIALDNVVGICKT